MVHALGLWIAMIFGGSSPTPAVAPSPAPTAWQARCTASLEQLRIDAAQLEPEIRGAAVELDDVREEVSLSAGPPIQHMPSLHIFVVHEPKQEHPWQRFVESLGGGLHITAMRATATADAAIMLDGWESARAQRLEPMLVRAVEQCVAP